MEEDIIYHYMRAQERKAAGIDSRAKRNAASQSVHLRMIQLSRSDGETDAALLARANTILARFSSGESFANLAREFDQSTRRDHGGDWGWVTGEDLRADYRAMALNLKTGEISTPILAKEGCFLLYAEDRR